MEVNETIKEVELDMQEDQLAMLSDEGRQAQSFLSSLAESDIQSETQ